MLVKEVLLGEMLLVSWWECFSLVGEDVAEVLLGEVLVKGVLLGGVLAVGKKRSMMPLPASPATQSAWIMELKAQLAAKQWKMELAQLVLEEWEAEHQLMPTALPSLVKP